MFSRKDLEQKKKRSVLGLVYIDFINGHRVLGILYTYIPRYILIAYRKWSIGIYLMIVDEENQSIRRIIVAYELTQYYATYRALSGA